MMEDKGANKGIPTGKNSKQLMAKQHHLQLQNESLDSFSIASHRKEPKLSNEKIKFMLNQKNTFKVYN